MEVSRSYDLLVGTAPALERMDTWLRARPWVADTALALLACLVLTTPSWQVLDEAPSMTWRVLIGAAALVAPAALSARRSLPRASFAVVSAALLVLALAPVVEGPAGDGITTFPPILLPSALAFAPSLYSLVAYSRVPAPAQGLVVGLVGAALSTWRVVSHGPIFDGSGLSIVVQAGFVGGALLAVIIAAWGLGRLRRMRFAVLEAVAERASRAEADREERAVRAVLDERTRIAREMHDIVAHSLSVIVRQAEGGRYAARADPALALPVLDVVADTGREALADMRSLLGVLRDGAPTSDGPVDGTGPQPTLADLPELIERVRRSGLVVDLVHSGTPERLDRAGELAVYRLVQEALTNVVRHAGRSARASVYLKWSGRRLTVEVRDDGAGSSGDVAAREDGHGLLGMRERLALAGGRMTAGAESGGGFAVHAELPSQGGRP